MRLQYTLAMDDLVRFARHHYRRSPTVRRALIVQTFALSAVAFSLVFYAGAGTGLVKRVLVAAICAGLVAAIVVWRFPHSAERQARKMYSEGASTGMLGERTLVIESHGLREVTAGGESFYAWPRIQRLDETVDDVFVYVSPVQAFIIPRKHVDQDVGQHFVAEIKAHLEPTNA